MDRKERNDLLTETQADLERLKLNPVSEHSTEFLEAVIYQLQNVLHADRESVREEPKRAR